MARYRFEEREAAALDARQRFFEAAIQEVSQKGFEGANINSISEAAGFAKGTIYNYFSEKRSLLLQLLAEIGSAHVAYILGLAREGSEPEARLRLFFEAGFAYVGQNPARMRLLQAALGGVDLDLKEELGRSYAPLFSFLREAVLVPGMADGAFEPTDARATATILMTLYLGSASQVDTEGRPFLDAGGVADFALAALVRRSTGTGSAI